jgi:hypothetical protein
MYKKITFVLLITSVLIAFALVYRHCIISNAKLIADQKVIILQNNIDAFSKYGFALCVLNLLWANIAVIKTKQYFWLWISFFITAIVALLYSYCTEDLFIFKKQNGMGRGSFSLNYLSSVLIICMASIVLSINYWILKKRNR